ncbi:adenylate/guanylate cyclase domain-containing protein [Mesorhizobium sp. STM 4661]|uniref:ATP-binding protein n=1 Tax=Mesorhizobium sp. STM 4661 TaxID=1297570 RepID=UPI0003A31A93|nr:adenylate/guanylate cyclase domain-containing protein [Mesorhizobium sp. STM 4661]
MLEPRASGPTKRRPGSSATLAFLFTDIEGSTDRWERLPTAMQVAIERHDLILSRAVKNAGGRIFKRVGDAVHAVFPQAFAALCAAIEAQRALHDDGFQDVEDLKVRMAIHIGAVQTRDDDFFGPPLNRLSRMVAAAHGGQILVSDAASIMIDNLPDGAALLDLGQHLLRDVATPQRLHQLMAPGLGSKFPPLKLDSPRRTNIPQQTLALIGRDTELRDMEILARKFRLITLVGPGGVGKTRVGLEFGREAILRYPDGVWVLELASLTDGQLVAESLATLFGGGIALGRLALDTVVSFLRDKSVLIILDSCEHLLLSVAETAEAILRNCAGVSLICTSREPLAVRGERIYRIPSLSFPTHPDAASAESALRHPAVRLFAERGSAAGTGFTVGKENVAAVCTICKRLDGLPLALEIAASHLRALLAHELADLLEKHLIVLGGASRTALPQQQTLQSVFEWSFNLLVADEQTLLKRLAIFAGGFTLESAQAVATDSTIIHSNVFNMLSSLVDKSLVTLVPVGHQTRYRLLESTRSFALGRLAKDEHESLARRLCSFLISFYAEASAEWLDGSTDNWLQIYAPDLDNLRASLEWAFGANGEIELGLELASHSLRLMLELSLFPEIDRWFQATSAHVREDTPLLVKARLLYATSYVHHAWFGGRDAAQPALEAAALFRASGSTLELAQCLVRAGQALSSPTETRHARLLLEESHMLLPPYGDTKVRATCLLSLGVLSDFEGNFLDGYTLLKESADIFQEIEDNFGMRFVLICLAENRFSLGAANDALMFVQQAIDLAVKHNHRHTLSLARMNLAAYQLILGMTGEARETARESLRDANTLGLSSYIVILVEHLALVAALDGKLDRAARMLGYSDRMRLFHGSVREGTEQKIYERLAPLVASIVPREKLIRLAGEGAAWTEGQAVEHAMAI